MRAAVIRSKTLCDKLDLGGAIFAQAKIKTNICFGVYQSLLLNP